MSRSEPDLWPCPCRPDVREPRVMDDRPRRDMTPLPDLRRERLRAGGRSTSTCCRRATRAARPGRTSRPGLRTRRPGGTSTHGAGAEVVTASALIPHGVAHAGVLLGGLSAWMSRKRFASVADVRGLLSVPCDADGAAYERSGYLTVLQAANRGDGRPGRGHRADEARAAGHATSWRGQPRPGTRRGAAPCC
jgi:hypothetical protein